MRRTWVYIDGVAYEKGTEPSVRVAPDVMPDIQPYKSMLTGELITSRSRHREHLRERGYVEVGNDSSLTRPRTAFPDAAPEKRRELLRAQVNEMTHEQWKAAGKRDLDRLRWQTNGIPDPLKNVGSY